MIQHTVTTIINGVEYAIHLAKEVSQSSCRHKQGLLSMFGSSDEITSIDSEAESIMPLDTNSPEEEIMAAKGKAQCEGEEDSGSGNKTQRPNGQGHDTRLMGNTQPTLSRHQNADDKDPIAGTESDSMGNIIGAER